MSSISPYYRGYRLALRDVQHATELYGNALIDQVSVMGAIHKAADMIALELTRLRTADSKACCEVREGESRVRAEMQFRHGTADMNDRETFGHGYRAGFDRALYLMTGHAWQMNDPKARYGILDLVVQLEQVRFEIALEENGKIRTLRARKFVL